MIVIVEGPDGSGKSTFVNRMRERISVPISIIRSSKPPTSPDDIRSYIDWVRLFPGSGLNLIFDRFVGISERIYGPILRGSSKYPRDVIYALESVFSRDSLMVIYCRPPFRDIEMGAKNQAQMKGVLTRLEDLVDAYDQEMKRLTFLGLNVIQYDRTASDSNRIWSTLNNALKGEAHV
jgi:hypothetical protein